MSYGFTFLDLGEFIAKCTIFDANTEGVKTEIGTLTCIASEEILYLEITRYLMMRGAEIFLHSSNEVSSPMPTQKNIAKLARATENMAYVVSANSAGMAVQRGCICLNRRAFSKNYLTPPQYKTLKINYLQLEFLLTTVHKFSLLLKLNFKQYECFFRRTYRHSFADFVG